MLVAVSIPIFTAQLEKSREATDAANIRSAYAEVMAEAITDGTADVTRTVTLKQAQDGWQGDTPDIAGDKTIAGTGHINPTVTGEPKKGKTCEVKYTAPVGTTAATVTITFAS